ncbi:MAG: hypothetical protein OK442_07160 [Thaumarchaeota archaeon]|nr:hypothetical protein [Nitrososphaerota archaeon]
MEEEERAEEGRLFKRDHFGLEETVVVTVLVIVIVAFVLFMLSAFGEWTP